METKNKSSFILCNPDFSHVNQICDFVSGFPVFKTSPSLNNVYLFLIRSIR
nr:MAG TPA: hypothetical protein [Caudoviricetes sp.]